MGRRLNRYGDGIEIERHVMPAVMCLVLGASTYAIGLVGVLTAGVRRMWYQAGVR